MVDPFGLYDMRFHERRVEGQEDVEIIRVPGGWIYRFLRLDCGQMGAVFVPWDNEFQPKTKAKEPWDEQ